MGLALVPALGFFSGLSATHRDLLLVGYALFLMALGTVEAFQRAQEEPHLRRPWRVLGGVFLLVGLVLGRQGVSNLRGVRLPSHVPSLDLWAWCFVALLLMMIPIGFNRAQSRSLRPWVRLLDGATFTVASNQVLWMWVLHPIVSRAGLPWQLRLGILAAFGLIFAGLGLSLHSLLKRGTARGPGGALVAAYLGIAAIVPWWVHINFMQELRPAHPFRLALLGPFLLLWLSVRLPWPPGLPERRERSKGLNLLPYLPAGFAFLGAFLHDLLRPTPHDLLGTLLLGGLALLVLLRQIVAFQEIWRLKQTLEAKVEARTRELADSSRLLLRTQRMNLIATLGAGLAHDLNNLIGAALLRVDLMEPELGDPQSQDPQDWEALRVSLTKAGQLTQRLMAFGTEGAEALGTVDVNAHLRSLQPLLRALVPRATALDVSCGSEALLVPGNPGLIDQVLVNLVVNARDATPQGGRIEVKAERLAESPGDPLRVCLSVVDSGSGIPPEDQERIFQPFFSTKEAGKGTGLGLGSVKAVVEGLGGRILLHSVVGEGSRFSVLLPQDVPSPGA